MDSSGGRESAAYALTKASILAKPVAGVWLTKTLPRLLEHAGKATTSMQPTIWRFVNMALFAFLSARVCAGERE
jgi:hypothetical protein